MLNIRGCLNLSVAKNMHFICLINTNIIIVYRCFWQVSKIFMGFFWFVFMIAGLINFLSIVDISRTSCHLLAPTVTSKDEKVYWKKVRFVQNFKCENTCKKKSSKQANTSRQCRFHIKTNIKTGHFIKSARSSLLKKFTLQHSQAFLYFL